MYYDGSGYLQTPSFAIPNTGILTIEMWMKNKVFAGQQAMMRHSSILMRRYTSTDNFWYDYNNGETQPHITFTGFFTGLDNQWIHIVTVCDYINKTLKAFRNGVQFDVTQTLGGTPVFPSADSVTYIGSYTTSLFKLRDGSLDEVRIYNRGLSVEEISQIYNQTKSKYQ
jgi:hypothetical protein